MRAQQVGRYRQRVRLQDLVQVADSYGQPVQDGRGSWPTLAEFWAEVLPLSGTEAVNVRQVWATASYRVRCRYQGPAAVPSPRMRLQLVKGGALLNILAVQNIEQRDRQYELICEEYTPA